MQLSLAESVLFTPKRSTRAGDSSLEYPVVEVVMIVMVVFVSGKASFQGCWLSISQLRSGSSLSRSETPLIGWEQGMAENYGPAHIGECAKAPAGETHSTCYSLGTCDCGGKERRKRGRSEKEAQEEEEEEEEEEESGWDRANVTDKPNFPPLNSARCHASLQKSQPGLISPDHLQLAFIPRSCSSSPSVCLFTYPKPGRGAKGARGLKSESAGAATGHGELELVRGMRRLVLLAICPSITLDRAP
ncbi:hypothetical protein EYF80_017950 [Liparis tanakae]|uniref:Uncharacterized protein n=1 Tax=Liparis tanakae TaxID=230148 RepID=A0A4Z2I106_9TELE|nr:hypothetical protein EYF80_017950 [Liparis tanakae]